MNNYLKIAFICGCLEPSKDGVGDYTVILAKQLVQLGHSCICISLNDSFVSSSQVNLSTPNNFEDISLIRFNSAYPLRKKISYIQQLLLEHQVTILSLQYVPYAFSKKGVPIRLLSWLPFLGNKLKWHIMCHELWVDSSLRRTNLLLAFFQKHLLIIILKQLKPLCIHTTNHYYKKCLLSCGFANDVLPLHSNIPYFKISSPTVSKPNRWDFIFFGSIHKEWNSDYFFSCIKQACLIHDIIDCRFHFIGRIGFYGDIFLNAVINKYPSYSFFNYGERSQDEISFRLQFADFGITTTPSHLIEKSGTVSAMLSHGLPIIITRITSKDLEWNFKLKQSPEFILLDRDFQMSISSATKYPPHPITNSSAVKLVRSIQRSI